MTVVLGPHAPRRCRHLGSSPPAQTPQRASTTPDTTSAVHAALQEQGQGQDEDEEQPVLDGEEKEQAFSDAPSCTPHCGATSAKWLAFCPASQTAYPATYYNPKDAVAGAAAAVTRMGC